MTTTRNNKALPHLALGEGSANERMEGARIIKLGDIRAKQMQGEINHNL